MANLKISQLPEALIPTLGDYLVVVNGGVTKKVTLEDLRPLVHSSHNEVVSLLANTPTMITHNLNNENIQVQTWSDTSNELVLMSVQKYSADTSNVIVIESTVADSIRVNILGL